jgi:hypothetical protein
MEGCSLSDNASIINQIVTKVINAPNRLLSDERLGSFSGRSTYNAAYYEDHRTKIRDRLRRNRTAINTRQNALRAALEEK